MFREFGAANADTLLNFDTHWDALRLDTSAFSRIVYNTSTGQLYYDADGAGGADAQLVATLQGAPVVHADDIFGI